jgi:two-component system, OmpR family, response regulator
MNMLIIEDDVMLAEKIGQLFETKVLTNRIKILHSFEEFMNEYQLLATYDIILTDLKLSIFEINDDQLSWFRIIKMVRDQNHIIPIIVISGLAELEKLRYAFELGANDYLIKPLRLKEIELRVVNWFQKFYLSANPSAGNIHYYNDLSFNIEKNEFYYRGDFIPLTKQSRIILWIFFSQPEKILSESFLVDKIWGSGEFGNNGHTFRVALLRLKQGLAEFGIDNWIQNIRGEGYTFSSNPQRKEWMLLEEASVVA